MRMSCRLSSSSAKSENWKWKTLIVDTKSNKVLMDLVSLVFFALLPVSFKRPSLSPRWCVHHPSEPLKDYVKAPRRLPTHRHPITHMLKCWKIATIEIDSLRDARKLIQLKLSRKLSRWIYCFFSSLLYCYFIEIRNQIFNLDGSLYAVSIFVTDTWITQIAKICADDDEWRRNDDNANYLFFLHSLCLLRLNHARAVVSLCTLLMSSFVWLCFRCKNNDQRSSKRSSAQMKTKILQMLRRQPWERWEMTRWGFSLVYSTVFPFTRSTWLRKEDDHVRLPSYEWKSA